MVRVLELGPGLIGVVFGVGSAGSLIGALLAGRSVRPLGIGPTLLWAVGASAAAPLLIPLAGGGRAPRSSPCWERRHFSPAWA